MMMIAVGAKPPPSFLLFFSFRNRSSSHTPFFFDAQEISSGQVGVGLFSITGQEISVPQARCTYLSIPTLSWPLSNELP